MKEGEVINQLPDTIISPEINPPKIPLHDLEPGTIKTFKSANSRDMHVRGTYIDQLNWDLTAIGRLALTKKTLMVSQTQESFLTIWDTILSKKIRQDLLSSFGYIGIWHNPRFFVLDPATPHLPKLKLATNQKGKLNNLMLILDVPDGYYSRLCFALQDNKQPDKSQLFFAPEFEFVAKNSSREYSQKELPFNVSDYLKMKFEIYNPNKRKKRRKSREELD